MSLVITQNPQSAMARVRKIAKRLYELDVHNHCNDLGELLSKLPIIHKPDLVTYCNASREDFLANAILFSETSGTTASPLQTPRGKQDLAWNVLNQTIAYKGLVQPGIDRVAILHPSVLSPFVEASALALQALGVGYVRVFPIPGVCEYQRIYDVLERYEITAVMSTPSLVYKLLFELGKLKKGKLPPTLKNIFVTGERFLPESARNLERIIGQGSQAQPFVYGASETATIMVGRPDGNYRPITEDFIYEIHNDKDSSMTINPVLGESLVRGNLIVSWLRDGMLPILRYDTGDIFTVRKEPVSSEYVFQFEGRNDSGAFDIDTQHRIEGALYNLLMPIYHFECRADFRRTEVAIDIITAPECEPSSAEVASAVTNALAGGWSATVSVNRSEHPFLAFSPSPKTQKFIKC
jgi:phenylacetate-coenzyme A ligase PaaK-like adenylate-forming protein